MPYGLITDVPGVQVGHWTDLTGGTGVTAILTPQGSIPGVYIAGLAPATREIEIIKSRSALSYLNAVVLGGGSAYGLGASDGVMGWLRDKRFGLLIRDRAIVPIVVQADIFDLFPVGNIASFPTAAAGYEAAESSTSGEFPLGNVGGGTGATSGKFLGPHLSTKTGLGSSSVVSGAIVMGALTVVNAVGNIVNPLTREVIAGARQSQDGGGYVSFQPESHGKGILPDRTHTTLTVIATNAKLDKIEASRLARLAGRTAYRASIEPCMTKKDGDVVFSLSSGKEDASFESLLPMAIEAIIQSILCAVSEATSVGPIPSASDIISFQAQGGLLTSFPQETVKRISRLPSGASVWRAGREVPSLMNRMKRVPR